MKVSEEPGAKIGAPQDTAQVPSEIQIEPAKAKETEGRLKEIK